MRYVREFPDILLLSFLAPQWFLLFKLPVETIGTRFGGIPSGFPTLKLPHFRLDWLRPLISPAITVAMLGAIESLMSAVVSDRMSGGQAQPECGTRGTRDRQHSVAVGLGGFCYGCHRENGHQHSFRSENAGIRNDPCPDSSCHRGLRGAPGEVHSIVSCWPPFFWLCLTTWAQWREIPELLKLSRMEIATWLATFLLTVVLRIYGRCGSSMILAVLVFIKKVHKPPRSRR